MALEPGILPDEYLPLLDELNNIVIASGVPLEGNLFYYHNHATSPSRHSVYEEFAPKRRNFAAACRASTHMLEIGVNAGHSSLLALANGVQYHGVDNCHHPYTRPVTEFLKSKFGDRFHFYEGDSKEIVPNMPLTHPYLRFNLLHVDGHHNTDYIRLDTLNILKLALKNAWLIIDDTDYEEVEDFYKELIGNNTIRDERPEGWEDYWRHAIGRVP